MEKRLLGVALRDNGSDGLQSSVACVEPQKKLSIWKLPPQTMEVRSCSRFVPQCLNTELVDLIIFSFGVSCIALLSSTCTTYYPRIRSPRVCTPRAIPGCGCFACRVVRRGVRYMSDVFEVRGLCARCASGVEEARGMQAGGWDWRATRCVELGGDASEGWAAAAGSSQVQLMDVSPDNRWIALCSCNVRLPSLSSLSPSHHPLDSHLLMQCESPLPCCIIAWLSGCLGKLVRLQRLQAECCSDREDAEISGHKGYGLPGLRSHPSYLAMSFLRTFLFLAHIPRSYHWPYPSSRTFLFLGFAPHPCCLGLPSWLDLAFFFILAPASLLSPFFLGFAFFLGLAPHPSSLALLLERTFFLQAMHPSSRPG